MPAMACDVCGGKVVSTAKENWFVCVNCGTEYPLEWMRAKFQKAQKVTQRQEEDQLPSELAELDAIAKRWVQPPPKKIEQAEREGQALRDVPREVKLPTYEVKLPTYDERKEQQQAQWREASLCEHCGGPLNLLGNKCKSCGKRNDYKERGVI